MLGRVDFQDFIFLQRYPMDDVHYRLMKFPVVDSAAGR